MTTREYTKILAKNPKVSTIEINDTNIRGVVTIVRFRPLEEKKVGNDTISYMKETGNEVDITFSGSVKSSMSVWHDAKSYNKSMLTRWLRRDSKFNNELHNRTSLIGGDRNTKIKKIDIL